MASSVPARSAQRSSCSTCSGLGWTAAARWGGREQEAVCPAPWRETGWLDHGEERGGLQRLARCPWPDRRAPSLRWILCHLSEEYARYTGQADLLREAVDGPTGE